MTAPTTDWAHTEYANAARTRKAAFLMDALHADGLTAADAVHLTDEQWKAAAKAARVRPPSRETRRLVVDLMAHDAAERTVTCPTCGCGNPLGTYGPPLPAGHAGECTR